MSKKKGGSVRVIDTPVGVNLMLLRSRPDMVRYPDAMSTRCATLTFRSSLKICEPWQFAFKNSGNHHIISTGERQFKLLQYYFLKKA